jgi:hypothetical protein
MSATGTAIQIQRGRPRGAMLLTAVLATALGVGFFAGRVTETRPASTSEGISATIPAVGWDTSGAAIKVDVYSRTFGGAAETTGGPAIGGFAPHLPKHVKAAEPTSEGGFNNHHLPRQWHM